MTNAEKIRALPDEVLAYILYSVCVGSSCGDCPVAPFCNGIFRVVGDWLEWLRSPVEGSNECNDRNRGET